jgi:hypothetical protein
MDQRPADALSEPAVVDRLRLERRCPMASDCGWVATVEYALSNQSLAGEVLVVAQEALNDELRAHVRMAHLHTWIREAP